MRASAGMLDGLARSLVKPLLDRADVRDDGARPWDLVIHDRRFYSRLLAQGSLAFGESYMEGWWDCASIDELVRRVVGAGTDDRLPDWQQALLGVQGRVLNLQSQLRARRVAEVHYDLGNDFYAAMLGPTMSYSCGYWRDAADLDAAQTAKMDLICRKLELARGQRLLDIGCGFGSLARFAAEHYGCECVGITISKEQHAHAVERCAGLPVRILLRDYRDADLSPLGPFDKVVSVGMFEHVGRRNYRNFVEVARRLLRDDGLFLLHTIGNDHEATDPWTNRYIFPHGSLPTSTEVTEAVRGVFVLEDWHTFRADYDRTLMAWLANFERHIVPGDFKLDARFIRMWRFYLLAYAGAFRAGARNQLWQVVLSPGGVPRGYLSRR